MVQPLFLGYITFVHRILVWDCGNSDMGLRLLRRSETRGVIPVSDLQRGFDWNKNTGHRFQKLCLFSGPVLIFVSLL